MHSHPAPPRSHLPMISCLWRLLACVAIAGITFVGCAEADSNPKTPDTTDPGKDPDDGKDPGKDPDDGKDPGKDPDDGKDPDKTCQNGLVQCKDNITPERCDNNTWVSLAPCPSKCEAGKCITENSCATPYALHPNDSIKASTATGNTLHSGSNICTGPALNGEEAVIELNIPQLGYYTLQVNTTQATDRWAVYQKSICTDDSTAIGDSCRTFQKVQSFTETRLYNPGKSYLFIDSIPASHGVVFEAKWTMAQDQSVSICRSPHMPATGELIQLKAQAQTFSGNTSDGQSRYAWNTFSGCSQPGTGGREIVYPFRLDKPTRVQAGLSIKPASDKIDQATLASAVYVISCSASSIAHCVNQSTGSSLSLDTPLLSAGDYALIVDSKDAKDFEFTLTVSGITP